MNNNTGTAAREQAAKEKEASTKNSSSQGWIIGVVLVLAAIGLIGAQPRPEVEEAGWRTKKPERPARPLRFFFVRQTYTWFRRTTEASKPPARCCRCC